MGRDFPHPSRLALGSTQPPVQWVPGLSWGVKRPGSGVDHPPPSKRRGHEGLYLYFYLLGLSGLLYGEPLHLLYSAVLSTPRPGRFTPRKNSLPIVYDGRWSPVTFRIFAKNLTLTGIQSPDRPARSESLYRLSYRGPPTKLNSIVY